MAAAPRLDEALEITVNEICFAMETEVCSIYLADHDRRCYYLMATRGLKKPRGKIVTLAFDQGIVGLVGRLAEPINLADAQSHPSFKFIPSVKEERFRSFLGVPIITRRQLLGVLVVQQREHRQFDESEESFLVTLATQMATLITQSQLSQLFGHFRQKRVRALAAAPRRGRARLGRQYSAFSGACVRRLDAGCRARARAAIAGDGRGEQ